ncbi:MAG: hypothetical protein WAV25_00505 [Minisyncoccia bacterium]
MREQGENDFELKTDLRFESITGTKVKLEILSDEMAEMILSKTQIHAGEKDSNDPEMYKRNGLEPYAIMFEGFDRIFAFSRPFKISGDRTSFIGYAREDDNTYTARSYYLSNSHGVFKYLPGYIDAPALKWFDKGFDEQSVSATHSLQRVLSYLSANEDAVEPTDNPNKLFHSTARNLIEESTRQQTYKKKTVAKPIELVINENPEHKPRLKPEDVHVEEHRAPDFEQPLDTWTQENSLYGQIILSSFYSKDKTVLYTFGTDMMDRSWVACVEPVDKGNSMGIHSTYFMSHSLTTPAYEYSGKQAEGYGNYSIQNGHYVDMYKNYLSKIDIIKQFRKVAPSQKTQEFPIPDSKIA